MENTDARFNDVSLLGKVEKQLGKFKKESNKHKWLHRSLWSMSTLVSLGVAFSSNFDFVYRDIDSTQYAAFLGILLPAITAYTVLRSPEKLWIAEICFRNRLADLKDKIELALRKDPDADIADLEAEYFEIMGKANEKWLEIKNAGS